MRSGEFKFSKKNEIWCTLIYNSNFEYTVHIVVSISQRICMIPPYEYSIYAKSWEFMSPYDHLSLFNFVALLPVSLVTFIALLCLSPLLLLLGFVVFFLKVFLNIWYTWVLDLDIVTVWLTWNSWKELLTKLYISATCSHFASRN